MNSKQSGMPTNTSSLSKNRRNAGFTGELPEVSPERKRVLTVFLKAAGIKFRNFGLLNLSFMHRSVSNESSLKINNERLEFLGDAVLGAAAASLLYRKFGDKPEGELSKIKSVLVSEDILSGVARQYQIDSLLILGKGEENSGGRSKKAILADAMEALIGAIFLDSGFDSAYNFVSGFLNNEINHVLEDNHHRDYKSLLQELSQRLYRSYPAYKLLKRSGPDHEKLFWVEVTVNNQSFGPATGYSKKSAEQEAARMAMESLSAAGDSA